MQWTSAESVTAHYDDVIMSVMASQITSLTIVLSSVYSGADQRKHQSSASLDFVRGIQGWPLDSHHKGPVTRKMSPFDNVIMHVNDGTRNGFKTLEKLVDSVSVELSKRFRNKTNDKFPLKRKLSSGSMIWYFG